MKQLITRLAILVALAAGPECHQPLYILSATPEPQGYRVEIGFDTGPAGPQDTLIVTDPAKCGAPALGLAYYLSLEERSGMLYAGRCAYEVEF